MTDTLQVGDFVRRATGGTTWWSPPRDYADAHFMVVGRNGAGDDMLATLTPYHSTDPDADTFRVGWRWATRTDATDLVDQPVLRVILDAALDARGWMIRESGVEKVPLDEVRVPQQIERLHRDVMAAVNGRAEPVLLCRHRSHPMREHRHSVLGSGGVMYRSPDETSMWTPLPGLWARDEARTTEPSRVRDIEVEHGASPQWPLFECTLHVGDHMGVHYHVTTGGSEFDPTADGPLLMWNPTVHETGGYHTERGRRYARADLLTAENAAPCENERHGRGVHHHVQNGAHIGWERPRNMHLLTGYTDLGLFARKNTTTTTEGSSTVPSTTDNLHPITSTQLRENPHLRITSKPIGQARYDGSIVFGCQTFTPRELRDARATITYGEDRRATVTADGHVHGDYLIIAGHTLGRADVNQYADTIVGITAPTPQYNAIVMEHGFYKCETDGHDHVIVLTNGPDGPVVGYTDGTGGIVGQRDGLTGPSLRRCVPARYTSATMQVMGFTRHRNFSAVPVNGGFDFTDRVGVAITGDSVRNVRQDGGPL